MGRLTLRTGFRSESPRRYSGEPILRVLETREDTGETKHLLENGMWIVEIGPDRYQTEWNAEEFWGRVDDGMTGTFGFVLLQVDRRRGLRLYSD